EPASSEPEELSKDDMEPISSEPEESSKTSEGSDFASLEQEID
ncbi:uncharacterized protein NPIL_524041, partial [Nephila pilipes]